MEDGNRLPFFIAPHVETGETVFTGLKGDIAPEGFTAVYDEREKMVSVSGKMTLEELECLADTLSRAEKLRAEWEAGGSDAAETGPETGTPERRGR